MPENAVFVGRPTQWGNPYVIKPVGTRYRVARVDFGSWQSELLTKAEASRRAVWLYETVFVFNKLQNFSDWLDELRGKNLVCWCPPDQPCHADVLLKLANESVGQ